LSGGLDDSIDIVSTVGEPLHAGSPGPEGQEAHVTEYGIKS